MIRCIQQVGVQRTSYKLPCILHPYAPRLQTPRYFHASERCPFICASRNFSSIIYSDESGSSRNNQQHAQENQSTQSSKKIRRSQKNKEGHKRSRVDYRQRNEFECSRTIDYNQQSRSKAQHNTEKNEKRLLVFRDLPTVARNLTLLSNNRKKLIESWGSISKVSYSEIITVTAHVMDSLRSSIANGTCQSASARHRGGNQANGELATLFNQALMIYSNPQISHDDRPTTALSRFDEAVKIVGDMLDAKLDVTVDHFTLVLRIAAAEERWEDAAILFTKMLDLDAGMTPLLVNSEEYTLYKNKKTEVNGRHCFDIANAVRIGLHALALAGKVDPEATARKMSKVVERLSMISPSDSQSCK